MFIFHSDETSSSIFKEFLAELDAEDVENVLAVREKLSTLSICPGLNEGGNRAAIGFDSRREDKELREELDK